MKISILITLFFVSAFAHSASLRSIQADKINPTINGTSTEIDKIKVSSLESSSEIESKSTFIPGGTNIDLGSLSKKWRDIYSYGEHKGLRIENFLSSSMPSSSSATKGRIIFVTDTQKIYIDTGSSFIEASGEGGISQWQTAKFYSTGSIVHENSKIYKSVLGHTSSSFSTDLSSGKWLEISSVPDLTGEVTSVGSVATIDNASVINKVLTGLTSVVGTISSTDSILQAIGKLDGNVASKLGVTKSDDDASPVSTTQLEVPNSQLTTTGPGKRRIETGNGNVLKNPSFEHSTISSGWTLSNGSCAPSTAVTIDGNSNCLFTSLSSNWSIRQESTFNAARISGQLLQGELWVSSNNSSDVMWLCPYVDGVLLAGSVANGCAQYTNIGKIQKLIITFKGGTSSNGIIFLGAASGTVVGMDKAKLSLSEIGIIPFLKDSSWQPCIFPTLSWQGLGTVTNNLQCSQSGPDLKIRGHFISGGTSGSLAEIPFPINFGAITSISNLIAGQGYGTFYRGVATSNSIFSAISAGPSTNVIRIAGPLASLANNPTVAVNANGFLSNTETAIIDGELTIPIQGWDSLSNSALSGCRDNWSCEKEFRLTATTTSGIVDVNSENVDFVNGNCTAANPTICTFSRAFPIAPQCSAHLISSANVIFPVTSTTTSVTISSNLSTSGAAQASVPFLLRCSRASTDSTVSGYILSPLIDVMASYWVSANFSANTTTPINFDSREFDSHNAVTTSSTAWRFTAPAPRTYRIVVYADSSSTEYLRIVKNGTLYKQLGRVSAGTTGSLTGTIKLLTGEYIDIKPTGPTTISGGLLSGNGIGRIEIISEGSY